MQSKGGNYPMSKSRNVREALSILIAMLLVLGSFSSFAYAENITFRLAKEDLKEVAAAKIMPEVKDDMEKQDIVEVLVYLKDQTDTEKVAETARNALSMRMTPYNVKLGVRRAVVEALRDKAERTQYNLLKYLEKEKEKGNVEEYQSYNIVNMVYVKGKREVIQHISNMTEVGKIYKNKVHQMDWNMDLNSSGNIDYQSNDNLEWNIERINADKVWDLGFDGTGVVVASLDTGVDWTHRALKEKWRGYDPETGEVNPEGNWFDPVYRYPLPRDPNRLVDNGRGTYIMGVMVGQEPDGGNKIGVAPGAKWIAVNVFYKEGYTTDNILLIAADWILAPEGDPNKAPDVVNNSWGKEGMDDWFRDVVNAWKSAYIFPVFSAGRDTSGNEPSPGSILSPASYPESFAVGAVDINNRLASFSRIGPSPYDETIIKPDIVAPGVRIRSSIPGNGYYTGSMTNTCIATPHISGTVALLLSANNILSPERIEEILTSTARPLVDERYPESPNFGYGYGLVDALEAISIVFDGTGYISGRVLQQGEDQEDALIIHEQEIFEIYSGTNTDIIAQVLDDVSVTEVELLVKQKDKSYWIMVPMERISGDHKNGTYKGTITGDMLSGDSIVYKIRARDYAGEETVTEDYRIDIKFGIIPDQYEFGFEDEPIGWVFDGCWQWGTPSGPSPEPYEGNNVAGTVLNGNYPNEADDWLITPPLDLRNDDLETVTLRFYEWYDFETNYDKGYVLVTNDNGETWNEARPFITGINRQWREVTINLSNYIGSENPVYVAFRFTSDRTTNKAGWYIDNVRLIADDNEAPMKPLNLSAEAKALSIALIWDEVSDSDLSHYNIYRSVQIDSGYELIGQVVENRYFDTDLQYGVTYYYKVAAEDISGNISECSEPISAKLEDYTVIQGYDFEEDNGGFVTGVTAGTNNPWEWGIPTSGPNKATSGEKLWATNLSGEYQTTVDAYIESPRISLPSEGNVVLAFNHWIETQEPVNTTDYGQVLVSNDEGDTWTNVTPGTNGKYGGYIREWREEQIPLSDFKGQDIKIRFYFHSNYSANYLGWYIDDVYIISKLSNDENSEEQTVYEKEDVTSSFDIKEPEFKLNNTEPKEYKTVADSIVRSIPMSRGSGIPVENAIVTLVDTGTSVVADPSTGKYIMRSEIGERIIRAEAYGFYPQEAIVNVEEGRTVYHTFVLERKPQADIIGRVVTSYYNEGIPNAEVRVVEDANIEAVITDENGNFVIEDVYEGTYTLRVKAEGYEKAEVIVNIVGTEPVEIEIPLNNYVGYNNEIAYDDGTPENGVILNYQGTGMAVRFTPSEFGKVIGANMYFYEGWPQPGGTEISVAIYSIDRYGFATMVGEPKVVNVQRGQWNFIDLSDYSFATDRDFYISTIQTRLGNYSPGLGIDEDSEHLERGYFNIEGEFIPLYSEEIVGVPMIRAIMEYNLDIPRITNLEDISYVNRDSVTIEGVVKSDCTINVYINDEMQMSVESENGAFAADVELPHRENRIIVTAEINGRETSPSAEKLVIKDKTPPGLIVEEPEDNARINSEVVHIRGVARDDIELTGLTINGMNVEVDENGNFHKRLILNSGENIISVKAIDIAGNETVVERRVYVELDASAISNIEPSQDVIISPGETLTVSFVARPGGEGYFRLVLPPGLQTNNIGIPMTETDGLYTGQWVVPEDIGVMELYVEVIYIDSFGAETIGLAAGKLILVERKPLGELPVNTVIVGNEAYDINYLNNNSNAQIKLVDYHNEGNEIYIKTEEGTIVSLEEEIVSIDELPDVLIYYDINGEITKYVK